jgi:transcriptional regulator with XRE-family HTH domain
MAKKRTNQPTWAERISAIMSRYQLNQTQLAKRLRMAGNGTLSNIQTGRREPTPCVQLLIEMMEAGDSLEKFQK